MMATAIVIDTTNTLKRRDAVVDVADGVLPGSSLSVSVSSMSPSSKKRGTNSSLRGSSGKRIIPPTTAGMAISEAVGVAGGWEFAPLFMCVCVCVCVCILCVCVCVSGCGCERE